MCKSCWKKTVIKAIKEKSHKTLKKEFMTFSKLRGQKNEDENELSVKDYIKTMTLRNARTFFRIRSNMVDVKMNQKSNSNYANDLWKCDYCFSLDSQSHIMWCPAFSSLREGKNLQNDLDLVSYFQDVMKIRENQSL